MSKKRDQEGNYQRHKTENFPGLKNMQFHNKRAHVQKKNDIINTRGTALKFS